jgi:hypothetical protein
MVNDHGVVHKDINGFIQKLSEREPNEENVRTLFPVLERLTSDLRNLEREWYYIISKEEIILDNFEKGYAEKEDYKEKIYVERVKAEAFLNKVISQNNTTSISSSPSSSRRRLKLPKIKLKNLAAMCKIG